MIDPIDHEREDDYAAAIENNRPEALAWLNTALKKMSVEAGSGTHPKRRGTGLRLRNGAELHVNVMFVSPEGEKP